MMHLFEGVGDVVLVDGCNKLEVVLENGDEASLSVRDEFVEDIGHVGLILLWSLHLRRTRRPLGVSFNCWLAAKKLA